ncbi:MAG: hypothetical protein DRH03_12355 [Deltaproteobacteria bacterium]|nr:MAG: hypothetical protein DRH03_12355 [Deltaproteobacteria bacterium]
MTLFFPKEYNATPYRVLYENLSPVGRLMIQREFVGVSYLRRFYLLQKNSSGKGFRDEQPAAGRFLHKKLTINRLIWRHQEIVKVHLKLIFRHYLFGFLVQLTSRKQEHPLPSPSPSCYWETPANLTVLRWMNRHRQSWENATDSAIERVVSGSVRHHFIYCLLSFIIAKEIYNKDEMENEINDVMALAQPGATPIGIEMEFSNLGRLATNKNNPADLIKKDPFHNMEYYSNFQLEDVTWRLGGYVDTHEHGRRLISLSRYGGFFEYSMVRVDYPRTYTLPLTTDPAIANQMICESLDFTREIKPHSLHINIEKRGNGKVEPKLDDFLCLLLLGGDLGYNEQGKLKEKRFADKEFHRIIKLRRHLSLLDGVKKEVIEYAFLRLWENGSRNYDYLPVILAFKGFQYAYHLQANCLEQLPGLQAWAEQPSPLPTVALKSFTKNVGDGLKKERVYSEKFLDSYLKVLLDILISQQQLLR